MLQSDLRHRMRRTFFGRIDMIENPHLMVQAGHKISYFTVLKVCQAQINFNVKKERLSTKNRAKRLMIQKELHENGHKNICVHPVH